jgi:predicted  nucleic acid-binding Zn-ribbon protein
MLPDLTSVIRLQDLDIRVAELTREISALPVHISEIEKKLETHQRKLEADRAALSANQKERKKTEGDIQVQEQKISKLKGQMLEAKTNEVYQAFQSEIGFCEKEIRRLEDRILELMSESEPLELNVKAAEIAGRAECRAQGHRERHHAGCIPELREDPQDSQRDRRGGSAGRALFGLPHGHAPAILPGVAQGRPDHGLRELRANSLLQSAHPGGRRGN